MATRPANLLEGLDYSAVQQCIHCGMCLPSCPTYLETKVEKNSPRGRIALMRSIADGETNATRSFGEEMYYCLGCLACTTACPAGVDYPLLFERARAEVERAGVLDSPTRRFWRWLTLGFLFHSQRRLRLAGFGMRLYQRSGAEALVRKLGLPRLLPKALRTLEARSPRIAGQFSDALIAQHETPTDEAKYRVGLLTGCVQDLVFPEVNRDTADVLLENGSEVFTPRAQGCCGSLHAHNGDLEGARSQGLKLMSLFDLEHLDAVITNAAGCGSHIKHFSQLFEESDTVTRARAALWDSKVRDISEWLVETGFRKPSPTTDCSTTCTYHEACHLCHGQQISGQPREILRSLPGCELVELKDATRCCGSAGVYSITQPEQAGKLRAEKVQNIKATGAALVATANPGCHLEIEHGLGDDEETPQVQHVVSLLARAYEREGR